tara:strand:+ start:756 stop:944 length:189 start_codon:yes stop_codon:yes gene_type:complete
MKKEFQLNDIINAVNSIYKIEKKGGKNIEIKNYTATKDNIFTKNNQVKSNKCNILVLDEMIE